MTQLKCHLCFSCLSDYEDLKLTSNSDPATIVRAMSHPSSGLDVRDRVWLKISIPNAFIGKCGQALTLSSVCQVGPLCAINMHEVVFRCSISSM